MFPATLAMDDDHVNVNGRAREINHLFICSNMARAMKGGCRQPWTPDWHWLPIICCKVRIDLPGMCNFFSDSTPHHEQQNNKVSGESWVS